MSLLVSTRRSEILYTMAGVVPNALGRNIFGYAFYDL
jgi:hypothetical protein